MNIEVLSSLENVTKRSDMLVIGTHNGKFHSDEVVGCSILCSFYCDNTVIIVRTRDTETLKQCDICVDIGGGTFDHHQAGFNKKRENGIKYASAGLIWKCFGKLAQLHLF